MALVVYQGPTTDSTAEVAKSTKMTRFSSAPMQYRSNIGNSLSTIDRSEDFVGLVIYIYYCNHRFHLYTLLLLSYDDTYDLYL